MNATQQLTRLLGNRTINNPDNDVKVTPGRGTAQFRFSAQEASALVAHISKLPIRTQAALVRELHRRAKQQTHGQVNFINAASVRVINQLAKSAGVQERFEIVSAKDLPLKSAVYSKLPSDTWPWYKRNTALGHLPRIGDQESARPYLKRAGFEDKGNGRWEARDGSWVRFRGGLRLGWQKWSLGQLPFNNRKAV